MSNQPEAPYLGDTEDEDYESRCPACGDYIEYCRGHGESGDPEGYNLLLRHDNEDHRYCNRAGCDIAGMDHCPCTDTGGTCCDCGYDPATDPERDCLRLSN